MKAAGAAGPILLSPMCELCSGTGEPAKIAGADPASATRRGFLFLGLGFLAGCARQAALGPFPRPPWPEEAPSQVALPSPTPVVPPGGPDAGWRQNVLPRSAWSQGDPMTSHMDRMTAIQDITVHHDGMDPFRDTDRGDIAEHLESIRQLHRRKGWGDIGYHFAVDPAGRVWEARPLQYQGAHVKDHNPGNIGIVVLGNYELQYPSDQQLSGLRGLLVSLMSVYAVPVARVHSHREWGGAVTACPGRSLQDQFVRLRRALG
jgi:N-acetylmuramoyl-L-alanine amidase-like protein